MTAGELTFDHLGKWITVSGLPGWSVRGGLVAVAHRGPNFPGAVGFRTVLTIALDQPDSELVTITVSPDLDVVVDA